MYPKGWGSRKYPNVGAAGCTLTSGQPGAAWSGQEVCSGFALAAHALAAHASPSRLVVRIRTIQFVYKMYELVQKSHKKCTNWYKRHNMYEFVLVNLYTKISKKKVCILVGISTRDQYPRLKSSRFPCRGKTHCALNATHRCAVIHKTRGQRENYITT